MAKGCDTAAYLTDSRVDALVGKGYSFVGRYIDYLKGAHNDLTEKEVGLICNAGLEIVSLYQPKGMNSSTHYSASQGKSDVIEALELARYLRQPKNTAIYFCVDFDPLESVVRSNILPYFDAVYQAIIDKEGNVTNSKVTRSVDKDMDAEAIRLVKAMPKWKPGMQKGKAVAVKYTVPVVFRLEGGKTVNSQVTVSSKMSEFSVQGMNNPLYIVDGKEVTSSILSALDVNKIESMTVLKNESATEVYGEKGKNGVILITLKGSAEKSITLSNRSSVVNVPGLKGVYLNNRRAEWEDVDIFVDGEKIEMAGRALDEVVPPNRIESISVEKERNEAGRGKIYITTKAKEGVEKTSVRGDMKVEGFVQDKDGEPIVGATVLIEGTNMGTVTDVDGRFVMSASKGDKLVVSYIGMKGTKVKVASKVTITLKDE